jgi:predicted N-acetyltransferase YhbS
VTVSVEWSDEPRAQLRWLFELAEDSALQLDAYIEKGRVLVARDGTEVVGHLQLIEADVPEALEIKSMAVADDWQGRGIGRQLVEAAASAAETAGVSTLLVSTATADVGNLRFYQRLGFRFHAVERDAFTAGTGYPDPIVIDGIELRDRIWLSRHL